MELSEEVVMKKLALIATLWILVTSVWWAVGVLCFIVPSYEHWVMESGRAASAGLQLAIDVSRVLRDSWHWIAVFIVLVAGTLSSLRYTVTTGRRFRTAL